MDDPSIMIVKCDESGCDWQSEYPKAEWRDWLKKPCPKCGKGEIIDAEEGATLLMLFALEEASHIICEGNPDAQTERIQFDSRTMTFSRSEATQ